MKLNKDKYGGFTMSKSVYNGETRPSYWHREEAVNEVDNGWRVIGYEDTEEYLNNSDNWTITSINRAFDLFPLILEYFDFPIGTDLFIQFNEDGVVVEIWDLITDTKIFDIEE